MKIALVASEAVPFVKTGGLGDVVSSLGKELTRLGHEVTILMPLYSGIRVMPVGLISPLHLTFAGRNITYSIVESVNEGMKFVFVDAPYYFHRAGLYGDSFGDFGDNDERFIFFTRACIEYYIRRSERPDVFHCNDWQTGLFPLFLRTHYHHEDIRETPVVFTIHNIAYQGLFPADKFGLLELGWEYYTEQTVEFYGSVSFLKAGLIYSDILTTVSKKYSQEIQTQEYGYRMEGIIESRKDRLFGIQNGIDEDVWNPETDPHIARNYSSNDLSGKDECRKELVSIAGWDTSASSPIIGMVSRLTAQKGFDLLESAANRILDMDVRLFLLGKGEKRYEDFLRSLQQNKPEKLALVVEFNASLAHKIEAGADMYLMPSRDEPCGLNQMYSLRYGTVPIVRGTGGLDDSVQQWDWEAMTGNGFKFAEYSADALVKALSGACHAFDNNDVWKRIMLNGMKGNYSWRNSALQYLMVYEQAIQLKS